MRYLMCSLLFVFAISLSGQNWGNWRKGERIKGNGDVESVDREIGAFTGIRACCSFRIELTQGNDHNLRVEAESNILPYVETEVRGSTLYMRMREGVNVKTNDPIKIFVTMEQLEELSASSSSRVRGTNTFRGEDLDVRVSSSATVDLEFEGDEVEIDVSSSGRVELRGKASEVEAEVSSSGRIDAANLEAQKGEAKASSAGSVTLNVSERIKARASSAGSVTYYGNPSNVDSDTSSAGSVRSRN